MFIENQLFGSYDYYPFGMTMPGRSYTSGEGYRFGFQGQESDDEVRGDGNSVFFKYRVHDPRIGRFASVDPLYKTYPNSSPYAFAFNRVIDGVDLEGLEWARYQSNGYWHFEYNPEYTGIAGLTLAKERYGENATIIPLDNPDDTYTYSTPIGFQNVTLHQDGKWTSEFNSSAAMAYHEKKMEDPFYRQMVYFAWGITGVAATPAIVEYLGASGVTFIANEVKDEFLSIATDGVYDYVDVSKAVKNLGEVGFRKYWKKSVTFTGGRKKNPITTTIHQRDDLFDPNKVIDGMSNLDRMKAGQPPIGIDGEKVQLHHLIQHRDGAYAEVGGVFHRENKEALHIWNGGRGNKKPDEFQFSRSEFDKFRSDYWKERAKDF